MKPVRRRKYSGEELMKIAEANPHLVIKYRKQYRPNSSYVIRVQNKGGSKFLVLYSDESGETKYGQWEFDYGHEKSNEVIDYYEEELISKLDEKVNKLLDEIKDEEKTPETVVKYFRKGLAITGNEQKIKDAGFSDEIIEQASCIIIKNR